MAELTQIEINGADYDLKDSNALPKSGGTMTGALILHGDPTNSMEAATKQYVDNKQSTAQTASSLPSSGTALTANTIYNVAGTVNTYAFKPPASSGWAHGFFATGSSPSISFTGTIIGKLPTFEANKNYEFDVYNGVWVVQEVTAQ